MSEVGRWMVVDPATKTLLGGPYLWDGKTRWTPPEVEQSPDAGYQLMTEADAQAQGYHWPPPPDEAWVVADPSTMTIVAGPEQWNTVGTPPLSAVDPQQLMREIDATDQGYSYPQP